VIEPSGLLRIKSYVGKLPRPRASRKAPKSFAELFGQQFTS